MPNSNAFSNLNWSIIISSILVITGWGIGYYMTNNQNIKTKQREIITNYLIEAYRNIEDGCGRDSITDEQKRKMEKAIADIQLFGTLQQIELAKEVTNESVKTAYMDPRKLLIVLRNDLRKELRLQEASKDSKDIIHWRLK